MSIKNLDFFKVSFQEHKSAQNQITHQTEQSLYVHECKLKVVWGWSAGWLDENTIKKKHWAGRHVSPYAETKRRLSSFKKHNGRLF